jgi:hypothetical protein
MKKRRLSLKFEIFLYQIRYKRSASQTKSVESKCFKVDLYFEGKFFMGKSLKLALLSVRTCLPQLCNVSHCHRVHTVM